MYNINIPWRSYKIHLPDLDAHLKSYGAPHYCGLSAGSELIIHFTQEPSQQCKDLIQMHFDTITGATENARIALYNNRESAVSLAKESMLTSDITTWNAAERKIFMNLSLTDADKDSLVSKYGVQ